MSTYVFVTDDDAFERRARQALNLANGDIRRLPTRDLAADPGATVGRLVDHQGRPSDVLALGPGLPPEVVLRIAERVDELHPQVTVLLVVDERWEAGLLERAMKAGIRDVVNTRMDEASLAAAFHRAAQVAVRRASTLGSDPGRRASRVIAVLSPKGGSGKTTIATNLAAGLASRAPNDVVLADLDLTFGDVASALGIVPEHSVATAVRSLSQTDPSGLTVFLTPHRTGLLALCAPDDPAEGERVPPQDAAQLLALLGARFPYVVVDTAAGITEHTLAALESATDLLMLCTMDVASIRGLSKLVHTLDVLGYDQQTRHFVLNRASSRVGLDAADIERTVGLPIRAAVPSHRTVPLSMNHGQPLVSSRLRSPARRPLLELSERFLEPAQVETTRPARMTFTAQGAG
jgi:pilus assembly protein CpaE